MTERIGIWSMKRDEGGREEAVPLEELQSTETESRLEELLVASPDLLVKGLRLIGRQVQTSGGPLDLLGVDPDGRIVLFELKRGTLTRDAVAQILDYASDLIGRDPQDFASLIEASSGRLGIDRIEDFSSWFSSEFTGLNEPDLADLGMVLVGLGVDEKAKRVVNFLAQSRVDIQLLTFQAFQRGDEVFLARQVETVEPRTKSGGKRAGTKVENRRALEELAQEYGVLSLLLEVADFVSEQMPSAYRWPNKTCFAFSLSDVTEEGKPTARSYGALWVDLEARGQLNFTLSDHAIAAAGEKVAQVVEAVPQARLTSSQWTPFELPISTDTWPAVREQLGGLVGAVVAGWKLRMNAQGRRDST